MIGCPCGGFTFPASERRRGLVLRYERCGACGRCDRWRLEKGGVCISERQSARREYRTITEPFPNDSRTIGERGAR